MFLRMPSFGKPYKTRDGRKAVFLAEKYGSNSCILLIESEFLVCST